MPETLYRVLLIEDNPGDARLFREHVADATGARFEVECAERLSAALQRLEEDSADIDVVVVDLSLPDSSGLETFERVRDAAPDLPVVIMSGLADEALAVRAVQEGAEDYLVKGQVEPVWLGRSLLYAIERQRMRRQMRQSDQRLHQIVEQASDAFFIVDLDNHIVDINRRACDSLAYTHEELLGMTFSQVVPGFDDAKSADTWDKISRGEAVTFEGEQRRKDGSLLPVEIRMSQFELEGHFMLALARDVTDRVQRQQAEANLRRRQEEFLVAREIQQQLFPKHSPDVPGFDISGASFPADETGGDYYDYLPMNDGHVGIVIGDVGGHGIGPAILVGETHAYFRALSQTYPDVEFMLRQINRLLVQDTNEVRLISLFFLRLNPIRRTFVYAGAGHMAYWLHASGEVTTLERRAIPLGIDRDAEFLCSSPKTVQPNDIVLMTTDGIAETTNQHGEQFGDSRTLDVVRANRERPAQEIITALYDCVRQFGAHEQQHDDLTIVVVKAGPEPNK
jgi:sigma-B regulation protein RsbU (phosphoserine phosphatase)